jgi:hypothetical protein
VVDPTRPDIDPATRVTANLAAPSREFAMRSITAYDRLVLWLSSVPELTARLTDDHRCDSESRCVQCRTAFPCSLFTLADAADWERACRDHDQEKTA